MEPSKPNQRILRLCGLVLRLLSTLLALVLGARGATNEAESADEFRAQLAQNNGPISQNGEHRQYRVRHFGYFGGPSTPQIRNPNLENETKGNYSTYEAEPRTWIRCMEELFQKISRG